LVEFVLAGMMKDYYKILAFGNYLIFGVIHVGVLCNGL